MERTQSYHGGGATREMWTRGTDDYGRRVAPSTGTSVHTLGWTQSGLLAAFEPRDDVAAAQAGDMPPIGSTIALYEPDSGACVWRMPLPFAWSRFDLSATHAAIAGHDKGLVWAVRLGDDNGWLTQAHPDDIYAIHCGPNKIITTGRDGTIGVWEV